MGLLDGGIDDSTLQGLLAQFGAPTSKWGRRGDMLQNIGNALQTAGGNPKPQQDAQQQRLQQFMFLAALKQQAAQQAAQRQLQGQVSGIFQPPRQQAPLPPPGVMQAPAPNPLEALAQGASMQPTAPPVGPQAPPIQAPDVPMQAPPMLPTSVASPGGFQPPPVQQSPQDQLAKLDQVISFASVHPGMKDQAEGLQKVRDGIQKTLEANRNKNQGAPVISGGKYLFPQEFGAPADYGAKAPVEPLEIRTGDEILTVDKANPTVVLARRPIGVSPDKQAELAAAANKAPTTAEQEAKVQGTLAKLAEKGLLAPGSETDLGSLIRSIGSAPESVISAADKANAIGYLNLKGTPASQGDIMGQRVAAMMSMRPEPYVDTQSGMVVTKTAADIAKNPGRYVDAAVYGQVKQKQAIFDAFHYNMDNVRSKIDALGTMNQTTRLALASALQGDPGVLGTFIQGNAFKNLNPKQQDLIIAMRQLHQDASNLASVSGMGTGTDNVRKGIASVIPGAASASPEYARKQLDTLNESVKRLETALPKIPGSGAPMPSNIAPVVAPKLATHRYNPATGKIEVIP